LSRRRAGPVASAGTLFAFLAGCAGMICFGACSRPATDDDTLDLALAASPNKLDPALVVDVDEGRICALVFQGLVRFDRSGGLAADLAKTWSADEGGARYVFHLDTRMKYSNGRRVNASDVVWSYQRVLAPSSPAPRPWVLSRIRGAGDFSRGEARDVEGLSAPDDSTVVIELGEPFGPFLSMLALPAAMVVPREELELPRQGVPGSRAGFLTFPGNPIGSGAWQVAEWERGDYLLLTPNPHHPRASKSIGKVRYRIVPEAFTRVAEFESGSLDILEIPPPEQVRFLADGRYENRIQRRPALRVFYIGINNSRPPFDDVRVRRALNMAVNVDRLIEVLADGHAIRATGAIPPGLRGHVGRTPYRYDPAGARRLLAQAGHPGGLPMEIWQRDSPEGNRVLEAVQGYLHEAGVEVRLVRREWSAFKEAVSAGRVDAFYLDWYADYPDPENFVYPLFHSRNAGGGGNRVFFRDESIDGLIDAAARLVDAGESARAYARIDSLVYDSAPWIYLYFPEVFYAVSERISGYEMPALYLGEDFTGVDKAPE